MAVLEVTNQPHDLAAGGACYFCRTSPPAKKWVRTTTDIAYEGELDICEDCGKEIGYALGLVDSKKTEALVEEVAALKASVSELEPKAKSYDELLQHVASRETENPVAEKPSVKRSAKTSSPA